MELGAQHDDDGLSDGELIDRIACLDLRALDDNSAWVWRTREARLWWIAAQSCVRDSPIVFVLSVSRSLLEHVRRVVETSPDLLAAKKFLETGRSLAS